MSYRSRRFLSEHDMTSADKGSASLHQTVIIGPDSRNGSEEQRPASLIYNSSSRVPDKKRVEIGVLTSMARIKGRMGIASRR